MMTHMKTLYALLALLIGLQVHAGPTLKIEENEVIKSVLSEMRTLGSSPEVYPFSERYRLDLTLIDLVDQAAVVAQDYSGVNDRLARALGTENPNFPAWMDELKKLAEENAKFKAELDKKLYTQFYSPKGVALPPEYKYIDFRKVKDNGKLSRIREYNFLANDPEAMGLLKAFAQKEWKGFYTKQLTVAKLKTLKLKQLKKLHKAYYLNLIKLYEGQDADTLFRRSKHGLRASTNEKIATKSKRLFNALHALPHKHQIFFVLAQDIPSIPYLNGMFVLTPTFIDANFDAIEASLREYTLDQYIHSEDDRYLLSVRNYMKENEKQLDADLLAHNQRNDSDLKLVWMKRDKKPRRLEAIANLETLLTLYPAAPWAKGDHGTLVNRKGKEVVFKNRLGHFFKRLGRELIQTETYLSILAGTATLVLTEGNVPIAMSTQKLVKKAIETQRYDREWEEFLKEAPKDIIDAILMGSGLGAGRFFKIVALGAGQGFLQSLFTGQDLRTGAMVGAGLNIIQFYMLPTKIGRPMTDGFDAKSLAANRRLELLEKTVKGAIQGTAVAAIDGEDMLKAALKGSVYGLVSTQLLIWFVGTRYNPFKNYSEEAVNEMIELENEYQNLVGRGGEYAINRQLIMDANYRVGGVLPKMISASITLPGNVAMSNQGFDKLTTLTHEAHHLMQQHQSGVFGFYLFRYIPTGLKTGYGGHPDEHFLEDVIGSY